jgi:hypothetical protein
MVLLLVSLVTSILIYGEGDRLFNISLFLYCMYIFSVSRLRLVRPVLDISSRTGCTQYNDHDLHFFNIEFCFFFVSPRRQVQLLKDNKIKYLVSPLELMYQLKNVEKAYQFTGTDAQEPKITLYLPELRNWDFFAIPGILYLSTSTTALNSRIPGIRE